MRAVSILLENRGEESEKERNSSKRRVMSSHASVHDIRSRELLGISGQDGDCSQSKPFSLAIYALVISFLGGGPRADVGTLRIVHFKDLVLPNPEGIFFLEVFSIWRSQAPNWI